MNNTQKTLALLVGGAFAASITTTTLAAENPFAMKTLASGYMVADAHEKMKDGKCGTGKCGAGMKKKAEKAKEGACSAEKAAEGKCSAEKAAEGKCSAEKAKEGSCNH